MERKKERKKEKEEKKGGGEEKRGEMAAPRSVVQTPSTTCHTSPVVHSEFLDVWHGVVRARASDHRVH